MAAAKSTLLPGVDFAVVVVPAELIEVGTAKLRLRSASKLSPPAILAREPEQRGIPVPSGTRWAPPQEGDQE